MLCVEYYLPKAEPTRAQHCLRGPRPVSTLNFLCNEAYCYSFECFNHESKNKGIISDASVCLSVCDNVALKRMRCFRRGFYGKACFHAMFHFITGVLAVSQSTLGPHGNYGLSSHFGRRPVPSGEKF